MVSLIEIHKKLGPGLYENVYKDCLIYKMESRIKS
ncbi:MAG: hypothetical protein IPN87_03510 [Saprospiraceae bacterium]|nr:hypothetical protein [Candidatus Brachybacter algidus]